MKGLSEYRDRRICSYLLEDSVHLSYAGYYRMKKSSFPFLIPCHKIFYDGKIKLIYQTSNLVSLQEAAEYLTAEQWDDVMEQLRCVVWQLKKNQYFQFGQLELNTEKIYMNLYDHQIYMIYLPVYQKDQAISIRILEEEIKEELEKLYKMYQKDTKEIVLQRIRSNQNEKWRLSAPFFVVGKQKEEVQGFIADSKALSRRHFQLFYEKNQWWIMDLNSRNGTFLNKRRLVPNHAYAVFEGDKIAAADCEFCLL
ncbi:MAG: FHA domain-containing protein [Eubacteriales bacterium]|nr:FHA domain-containing protein [Eubacteriales bacterium]